MPTRPVPALTQSYSFRDLQGRYNAVHAEAMRTFYQDHITLAEVFSKVFDNLRLNLKFCYFMGFQTCSLGGCSDQMTKYSHRDQHIYHFRSTYTNHLMTLFFILSEFKHVTQDCNFAAFQFSQ